MKIIQKEVESICSTCNKEFKWTNTILLPEDCINCMQHEAAEQVIEFQINIDQESKKPFISLKEFSVVIFLSLPMMTLATWHFSNRDYLIFLAVFFYGQMFRLLVEIIGNFVYEDFD